MVKTVKDHAAAKTSSQWAANVLKALTQLAIFLIPYWSNSIFWVTSEAQRALDQHESYVERVIKWIWKSANLLAILAYCHSARVRRSFVGECMRD
jgi:hypothetical protein